MWLVQTFRFSTQCLWPSDRGNSRQSIPKVTMVTSPVEFHGTMGPWDQHSSVLASMEQGLRQTKKPTGKVGKGWMDVLWCVYPYICWQSADYLEPQWWERLVFHHEWMKDSWANMSLCTRCTAFKHHGDNRGRSTFGHGWLWMAMDGYGWLWMAPGLSQAQVPQTSFSRELFQTWLGLSFSCNGT